MAPRNIPVDRFDLVIFGGTGDLARRKILPALFRRWAAGQIRSGSKIIGAARTDFGPDEYRKFVFEAVEAVDGSAVRDTENLKQFCAMFDYVRTDAKGTEGWEALAASLRKDVIHAFYFSVGPSLFGDIAARLLRYEMATGDCRIVVEKPFGRDLKSATALNATLGKCFAERQIFRIDHYLGKETVQNLMAVRFANVLFEPLWNSTYIDHVQITVAEDLGVEGRGAYYNRAGAMRDMVQNHLMQLLCLTAMEPPSQFEPDAVRDEKLKIINALNDVSAQDIVRGQYQANDGIDGFADDAEAASSRTESYAALKVGIENWRWSGTPFYLRTGKRLGARLSEIAVVFKDPPHSIFEPQPDRKGNVLAIRLQPDEGMYLRVTIKEPGPGGMRLIEVPLDMSFAEALGNDVNAMPDAYERLIMDVIRGNQTLFMRGDEVEAAWKWADPIIAAWDNSDQNPERYEAGGQGPAAADALLQKDGRRWRDIE